LREKEPEAFRVICPIAGVFGAVETPGGLRDGRIGSWNSFKGSFIIGEEPTRGDGCVVDLRPTDPATQTVSLVDTMFSCLKYLQRDLVYQASPVDLPTGHGPG
jgi:hypothetical protein